MKKASNTSRNQQNATIACDFQLFATSFGIIYNYEINYFGHHCDYVATIDNFILWVGWVQGLYYI